MSDHSGRMLREASSGLGGYVNRGGLSDVEEWAETRVCEHSACNGLNVSRSCIFCTDVIRRIE